MGGLQPQGGLSCAGAIHLQAALGYCFWNFHFFEIGKAYFMPPLSVYDFQKKSSLIMVSNEGANILGEITATLADGEGLQAHAQSARYRIK